MPLARECCAESEVSQKMSSSPACSAMRMRHFFEVALRALLLRELALGELGVALPRAPVVGDLDVVVVVLVVDAHPTLIPLNLALRKMWSAMFRSSSAMRGPSRVLPLRSAATMSLSEGPPSFSSRK